MDADDEANITEIEILPDGRICVFGTSAAVIDVVNSLAVLDQRWHERLLAIRQHHLRSQHAANSPPAMKVNHE